MLKKIAGVGMLFAAVAVISLAGCKKKAGWGVTSTEIPIGEFASMNGDTADFGRMSDEGLQLAIEQINSTGGVLGKKLHLYTADDNSDASQAVTAVNSLIDQDGVVAVIGEVASTRSLAGGNICQKRGVPMLSPASTNPRVTVGDDGQVRKYIFRICFTDTSQGAVDGQFAIEKKWKNIAVLTASDSDYSKGLDAAFEKAFTAGGSQILDQGLSYSSSDRDFSALLKRIKDSHPDAVYVPGYYTEMPDMLTQAKAIGLDVPFFGGDGWDSTKTLTCPAAQGDYYSDHFTAEDPRPEVQAFVKTYQARWGHEPNAMSVLGYDAGKVMADAIKRAGSADPEAITAALAQTTGFHGVSGTITIDKDHNAQKNIYMLKIVDQKAKLFKSYPPQ